LPWQISRHQALGRQAKECPGHLVTRNQIDPGPGPNWRRMVSKVIPALVVELNPPEGSGNPGIEALNRRSTVAGVDDRQQGVSYCASGEKAVEELVALLWP